MARPIIHDGTQQREMTEAEHEEYLQLVADVKVQVAVADAIAAAKISARTKLKALGLTDAEIVALVG